MIEYWIITYSLIYLVQLYVLQIYLVIELSNYSTLEAYHITMTSLSINAKDLYFEFQELTPFHGEPTFDTLQKLIIQLKANASSVTSNLDKRVHGFIGVILDQPSHATLAPLMPFISLTHPGTLAIPPLSTQCVIALFKT